MNTKKIVTFITLVVLFTQSCYCQDAKLQNYDKNTQTNDTIIPSEEDFYDTPAEYSASPEYTDGGDFGFYYCVWDNLDFTDIEVIRSVKIVILNCMIDSTGNISAYKLLDPFTVKEIKKEDYTPFQKEIVKGLAKTEKWIPAHLKGTPIAFPIAYRFIIPRNFWESLE